MAQTFKTPSQIAQDYLNTLKGLRPDVNIAQTDSDWWVKGQVNGGVVAGVYADQYLIANDAFPQNARHDALGRFLDLYLQRTFSAPTNSAGNVILTGASGSYAAGIQAVYTLNGNTYVSTAIASLVGPGSAATASVPFSSIGTGQSQNLLAGTVLSISSPPAGMLSAATVDSTNIADGRDGETDPQASAAILQRIRQPIAGGTVSDYQQFAEAADPSVTSASVLRFPFGYGTVMVVITAGTTDIDTALNNGQAIVQIPSPSLVAKVQAYVDTRRPVTDCAYVSGPTLLLVNVTVAVRYLTGVPGDGTIPSNQLPGQSLTQDQLVIREVQRALYKTPPGGRQLGGSGFVVASEIEDTIDIGLSAGPYVTGNIPIVLDRQVAPLAASGYNLLVLGNQLIQPGTITVVPLV